jgi:hypothetical protein
MRSFIYYIAIKLNYTTSKIVGYLQKRTDCSIAYFSI